MRVEIHDEGFKPVRIVIQTPEEMAMMVSTLGYALHFLRDQEAHYKLQSWIEDLQKELE